MEELREVWVIEIWQTKKRQTKKERSRLSASGKVAMAFFSF